MKPATDYRPALFDSTTLDRAHAFLIGEARNWLLDCFPDEDDQDEIREADTARIVKAVRRHYAGGWPEFLSATLPVPHGRAVSHAND